MNTYFNCDLCGHQFPTNQTIVLPKEGKTTKIFCYQCYNLYNTCSTCANAPTCDFQTNPIRTPKHILKNIQRGPITMTQQIPNPERVKVTCAVNCKCFNGEECVRENGGWCNSYDDSILYN